MNLLRKPREKLVALPSPCGKEYFRTIGEAWLNVNVVVVLVMITIAVSERVVVDGSEVARERLATSSGFYNAPCEASN